MTTTTNTTFARETDEKLAELYATCAKHDQRGQQFAASILRHAGARYYYRGRRRVTDMKLGEALGIVKAELAKLKARRAEFAGSDENPWIDYAGGTIQPYDQDAAQRALDGLATEAAALEQAQAEMAELNKRYTGWSRFFLVTSSAGHIHSSMSCATCRPTTTYGWLPELSGKTEKDAVDAHGAALCSVCFPSAPVEWVGGKITKAAAARAAA